MKNKLLKKYRKAAKERVYLTSINNNIYIVYTEQIDKNCIKEYFYEKKYDLFTNTCDDNCYSFPNVNDECLKSLSKARRFYIVHRLRQIRDKSKGDFIRRKNYEKYLKSF